MNKLKTSFPSKGSTIKDLRRHVGIPVWFSQRLKKAQCKLNYRYIDCTLNEIPEGPSGLSATEAVQKSSRELFYIIVSVIAQLSDSCSTYHMILSHNTLAYENTYTQLVILTADLVCSPVSVENAASHTHS